LVEASNIIVNGKGRRYRSNWKSRVIPENHLDDLFQESVKNAIGDITRYSGRLCKSYSITRGDSRVLTSNVGPIDLCVFSPPYPNSFDYTDVYNIELYAEAPLESQTLLKAMSELIASRKNLWNSSIPEMVGGYFSDLLKVIDGVRENLSPNGTMWMVVGDSKYAGITIFTATILNELLLSRGWSLIKNEPFRSMRVSPQQGGQLGLDETLVVYQKLI
jgi:hypothetical protein